MRCKNCGSENDDNLYICQNCGSPLYDEEEPIATPGDETRVFSAPVQAESPSPAPSNNESDDDKKKKQIILIVVLSVILIAIITGTVIAVASARNSAKNENSSEVSVSESISQSTTKEEKTTEKETEESTTEETTNETTTQATTQQIKSFDVVIISNDGGRVSGDGRYELGKNATVSATADSGYTFDGWYSNGTKLSSNANYTFTVTKDITLQAIFAIVDDSQSGIDSGTADDNL